MPKPSCAADEVLDDYIQCIPLQGNPENEPDLIQVSVYATGGEFYKKDSNAIYSRGDITYTMKDARGEEGMNVMVIETNKKDNEAVDKSYKSNTEFDDMLDELEDGDLLIISSYVGAARLSKKAKDFLTKMGAEKI